MDAKVFSLEIWKPEILEYLTSSQRMKSEGRNSYVSDMLTDVAHVTALSCQALLFILEHRDFFLLSTTFDSAHYIELLLSSQMCYGGNLKKRGGRKTAFVEETIQLDMNQSSRTIFLRVLKLHLCDIRVIFLGFITHSIIMAMQLLCTWLLCNLSYLLLGCFFYS